MHEKMEAHLSGLGVGLLPRHLAEPHISSGTLVSLEVSPALKPEPTVLAFRAGNRGKALIFLVEQLEQLR